MCSSNFTAMQINNNNKTTICASHLHFLYFFSLLRCSWKTENEVIFVAQASKGNPREVWVKSSPEWKSTSNTCKQQSWQVHNCNKDSKDITTSHTFFFSLLLFCGNWHSMRKLYKVLKCVAHCYCKQNKQPHQLPQNDNSCAELIKINHGRVIFLFK